MSSKFIISASIVVAVVCLLQGCAAKLNPIGESKFDCNRKQDVKSVYCRSFKSVEASTAGEVPASRFDKTFNMSDFDRLSGIAPDDDNSTPKSQVSNKAAVLPHQVRNNAPLSGLPVREGPVIQRTWIKRFVDSRDVLIENLVVYREVAPTHWAGFTANAIGSNAQFRTYPHKAPSDNNVSLSASEVRPPPASITQFKQPGVTPEVAESAPAPAASGAFSMPQ